MTEIDTTKLGARIRKWWDSVSRFLWPVLGVLCISFGIQRLLRNEGRVLGYMDIGTGIIVAGVPLTSVKCSNCKALNPFEKVWEDSVRDQRFACHACGTRYKLPFWNMLFLWAIMLGWFIFFMAVLWRWLDLDLTIAFLDSWIFAYALLMLLVRFSHYERLDKA